MTGGFTREAGLNTDDKEMAYIITAVGAGGKTSYLKKRAMEYLRQGKRAAITTTTHIWPPDPGRLLSGNSISLTQNTVADIDLVDSTHDLHYVGTLERSGKLSAPSKKEYDRICREFDVVLVEGDGSHCMPVKIPSEREPVIPDHTDEIAVIMGAHAIGRRLDVVCQRYEGNSREKVTEQMLRRIAEAYYLGPLRKRFPKAKVFYELSVMPRSEERIAGVLMASGFGRRYGGNKLVDQYHGRALYLHALDHITQALGKENTIVVTQYEEILEQVGKMGIDAVRNDQAAEGISASIRLGTERAMSRGADAVMFFAADMPHLPSEEIRLYARQFIDSQKPYGCMEFGKEHICTNPGAFRLETGAGKLLQLSGDRGAMRIMKQEPWNIYYYQTAPEYAADIDEKPLRYTGYT